MLDLTKEGEAMAARRDDRDDIRANFVRRLVRHRCPELSSVDLELAFGDSGGSDPNASVLVEIADAVGDAISALEERLTELERGLPRRLH
jgi:hypothetical protein